MNFSSVAFHRIRLPGWHNSKCHHVLWTPILLTDWDTPQPALPSHLGILSTSRNLVEWDSGYWGEVMYFLQVIVAGWPPLEDKLSKLQLESKKNPFLSSMRMAGVKSKHGHLVALMSLPIWWHAGTENLGSGWWRRRRWGLLEKLWMTGSPEAGDMSQRPFMVIFFIHLPTCCLCLPGKFQGPRVSDGCIQFLKSSLKKWIMT